MDLIPSGLAGARASHGSDETGQKQIQIFAENEKAKTIASSPYALEKKAVERARSH